MRSPGAATPVPARRTRTTADQSRLARWGASKQERHLALRDESIEVEHRTFQIDEKAVRVPRQQIAVPAHVGGGDPSLAAERDEIRVDLDLRPRVADDPHIAVDMADSRMRVLGVGLRLLQANDALLEALPVVRHEEQRFRRRQRSRFGVSRRGDLISRVPRYY